MRNTILLVVIMILGFGIIQGACRKEVGKTEATELGKAMGLQCVARHTKAGIVEKTYYPDKITRRGESYYLLVGNSTYAVPVQQTVLQDCVVIFNGGQ